MKKIIKNLILALGVMIINQHLWAVPKPIRVQARLTDSRGAPISGTPRLLFEIYDAPTGGTRVWGDTAPQTVDANAAGLFAKDIGPVPTEIFQNGRELYLQISVQGVAVLETLTPRQKLSSVPYAFWSDLTDEARIAGTVKDGAITAPKIANGSVENRHITDGSVNSAKIADGAILPADIAPNAVTSAAIADLSVGLNDLGPDSVTSAKIVAGSITGDRIANDAITSAHLTSGSVGTLEIADNSINLAKIQWNSITTDAIINGAVTPVDIVPGMMLVPSGAILMFDTACPDGFARVSALRNTIVIGARHKSGSSAPRESPGNKLEGWRIDNSTDSEEDADDPRAYTVEYCKKI